MEKHKLMVEGARRKATAAIMYNKTDIENSKVCCNRKWWKIDKMLCYLNY